MGRGDNMCSCSTIKDSRAQGSRVTTQGGRGTAQGTRGTTLDGRGTTQGTRGTPQGTRGSRAGLKIGVTTNGMPPPFGGLREVPHL